ncbi:siderophore-interacting protein [Frankia sp. CNm7]|uniref:Siderophore-interacting protein n=1 Tax=Frankia nepalensis TaxID=1836974 RepID=A0A937UNN7_9ACTN|nr:siderophore-interacting protein [Frankia nepalensis]MBL7502222.1 siderophore-interacting protein [Frankia nepalensis]MBL7513046.1 siderophore-interacting protein [Frankia nepalensis]MBL7523813.1 siderophore-interacting protein [Frankia nepalensis]MBL7628273.1 siderophore-interacting protein [Frankia nepalensis]
MDTATPAPAPRAGRSRNPLGRLLRRAEVVGVEQLAARTRRVTLAGEALAGLAWTPGQHVSVVLADPSAPGTWLRDPRDLKRTYSVWDYQPDGRLDLAVYDHGGDAPGARWARAAAAGRGVLVKGPEGHLVAQPDAPYHVFAGDDTAAVAFGAILRSLPATAPVFGAIEHDRPDDALPLARRDELTLVYRQGAPAADSPRLPATLAALTLPAEPGVAYVAGEARAIQAIRRHLVDDRGWPRRAVVTHPFWTPGRRGMD